MSRNHLAAITCTLALMCSATYLRADSFAQVNLVSDISGLAANTDPNLKNPWGVAFSATSPFWVSNQATGTSTLYSGTGAPAALVVTIPGSTPPAGPTGQVFNSGSGFLVNGTPARFIFDTLSGTLAGWNAGTTASVQASTAGAVYTGLALNNIGSSTFLYAADSTGQIRVFDSNWAPISLPSAFVDPSLPAGLVPFNIQSEGANLYVTYAALGPKGAPLPGGIVDEFDTSGNFLKRIATGGALYAPWGLTFAPANFGAFSNDLLIGNFGNGEILVYDPITNAYLGTLDGSDGQPLVNPFLWALETRTSGAGVDPNAVYFTAGINDEQDGLFGKITVVPEPATLLETASGLIALVLARVRSRQKFF